MKMRRMKRLAAVAFGCAALNASALELVRDGKSDYVIAGNTNDPAVVQLQKYVERMTAARLPLVDALSNAIPEKAIVVTSDAAKLPFVPAKLSSQGYQVKVVVPNVYLYSPGDAPASLQAKKQRKGSPRGLQFGVFGLLDEFFGCRFLTPAAEVVPRRAVLELGDGLDAVREPSFRNRFFTNVPGNSSCDPLWNAKNRVGRDFYGLSFHSLFKYLPPKTYFKDHPEWYPENGGARGHGTDWFCWSNREMRKALAKAIREDLRTGKLAADRALALGQGDGPAKCTCAECEKTKKEYGTDSAAMLLACNEVAEEVAKEFHDRKIALFAYFNTQTPPTKAFKLHRNLVINYVRTGDHMKSLFHPKHGKFAADLLRWDDFADEITVWDWDVDFGNTLMPFPNIKARAEDIRFFRKWRNMTSMAPQILDGGDFIELREWLFARMMWDVSTDIEAAEREFMTGYYGPAAGAILTDYLMKFQRYAEEDPGGYNAIFGGKEGSLRKTLFTPERIADAESLFRRAMAAAQASGDTNGLERVRLSYLRGFAAIRLSVAKTLEYAEKDGRRYLLPGGDASLAEAVVGIGDLLCRGKTKIDEFGDGLFQLAKFTRLYGAELDSRVENDLIAMDGASAMAGGIMRLVDKKTGLDILAADTPGMSACHGFQHRVGPSTLPRKGKVARVGNGQEYRTFGNCGTSIWWTPDVLPIERVFTIADGERGFTMRTSMTENRKAHFAFTHLKDWFKYDVPFYTPRIGMLLASSAPTKCKLFVTDGRGGHYVAVQPSIPLEINIASNEHKTVWILDPDPKRPVIRIDSDDNVWGKIAIIGVEPLSALRVTFAAREKLTVRDDGARVPCGGMALHLLDRAEAETLLPPDGFNAEKTSGGVILRWKQAGTVVISGAKAAKGPWRKLGSSDGTEFKAPAGCAFFRAAGKNAPKGVWKGAVARARRANTLVVSAQDGDAASFQDAFAMLPQTPWTTNMTLEVAAVAFPYAGASLPKETVNAIGGNRLVIRGVADGGRLPVVNGGFAFGGVNVTVENLVFENPGERGRTIAINEGGPTPVVRNCTFRNFSNALANRSYRPTPGLLVEKCLFEKCGSGLLFIADGGRKDSPAVIQDNVFRKCVRAVHYNGPKNMVFRRNTFDVEQGVFQAGAQVWSVRQVNEKFGVDDNVCAK